MSPAGRRRPSGWPAPAARSPRAGRSPATCTARGRRGRGASTGSAAAASRSPRGSPASGSSRRPASRTGPAPCWRAWRSRSITASSGRRPAPTSERIGYAGGRPLPGVPSPARRPESGDRQAGQPVAETERLGAAVEDEPGAKPRAEPPLQALQTPEVIGPYRLGGLDLDADDPAGVVLEHAVDLVLVPVPIVVEPRGRARPGELAGELAEDEVLQLPAERGVGHRPGRQITGQPGVNENHLGRGDRPARGVRRPGRDEPDEVDGLQDLDVAAYGRRGDAELAGQPVDVEQPARLSGEQRDEPPHVARLLDVGHLLYVPAQQVGEVPLEEPLPALRGQAPLCLRIAAERRTCYVVLGVM